MSYLGKEFKLEKQENFDGFLKALGLNMTQAQVQAVLVHKPTCKLTKDGDSYTLTNTRPNNEVSEVTFKLGTEVNEQVNGKPTKSTFTMEGNTLIQVQKYPENGVTFTYKREFSDNEMVTIITSSVWDGVTRRYYKA